VDDGLGQRGGGPAGGVDVHVYEGPVARIDGAYRRSRGGARPHQVSLCREAAPSRASNSACLGDVHGG
jgi:hypothetical protein